VMTLSFALIAFGALAVVGRIAFHPSFTVAQWLQQHGKAVGLRAALRPTVSSIATDVSVDDRALQVSQSISDNMRREQRIAEKLQGAVGREEKQRAAEASGARGGRAPEALGGSWRRTAARRSSLATKRDRTQ